MAFPTPHVNWMADFQWAGFEIFGKKPIAPPHTWQDWIATGAMFVAAVALFLAGNWAIYIWRRDVMGIFSGIPDKDLVENLRAGAEAKLAQRKSDQTSQSSSSSPPP